MSLTRRFLDLARANVNALLTRADTSLDELTDRELQEELDRRRARRERVAAEEARRYEAERRTRVKPGADKNAQQNATHKNAANQNARLAECYRLLELPYGADAQAVKRAYRQLMRKYHPDLHEGDKEKQRAATELSIALTAAHDDLLAHSSTSR